MPEVSYAIVLTSDAERAQRCLAAVAAQDVDSEVLVSLHDVDPDVRAAAAGTTVIHDGADLAPVLAWNLALHRAAAPSVLVLHEDAFLAEGCVQRLLDTLGERPDAAAVGPRTVTPDAPDAYGATWWSDGATSRLAEPGTPTEPFAVDYTGSSCLLLDRAAAIAAGGFDPRFFPAIYLDAALGASLWGAGRTVLVDPRAVCEHQIGAMVDPARGPRRGPRFRQFLAERNRGRFRTAFAELLTSAAQREDELDATRPSARELADARARTAAREREVRGRPVLSVPARTLPLPHDLVATAAALRRAVEDEFLAELVAAEARLTAELAALHTTFAAQHAELNRVHRDYAALWSDRERLRTIAAGA